jgi:hypothetical protein
VADDTRDSDSKTSQSDRQLLVKNVHFKMKQLAWSAIVDVGGLVLGIVAIQSSDVVGGTTGSALCTADIIKNVYESITRLNPDQVLLYRATARLECKRRAQNLEPPFPTETEIISAVIGQNEENKKTRHKLLHTQLISMIGDSLVSKVDGRIAVY